VGFQEGIAYWKPGASTMPSEARKNEVLEKWRGLGFFVRRDDQGKAWRFIGSRCGLLRFRDLLVAYVENPKRDTIGEHDHYGPYHSLEIMTWTEAGLDEHAIRGSLTDLRRLAMAIETKLSALQAGDTVSIQLDFSTDSPYSLLLDIREDGFDPAQSDLSLTD
jgi:hypothetical protein